MAQLKRSLGNRSMRAHASFGWQAIAVRLMPRDRPDVKMHAARQRAGASPARTAIPSARRVPKPSQGEAHRREACPIRTNAGGSLALKNRYFAEGALSYDLGQEDLWDKWIGITGVIATTEERMVEKIQQPSISIRRKRVLSSQRAKQMSLDFWASSSPH